MKVLVVHPKIKAVLGGGEKVCLHTVKALAEDGHEVSVLSDNFSINLFSTYYGIDAKTFPKVEWIPYEAFEPITWLRFSVYQRLLAHKIVEFKLGQKLSRKFDIVFSTQDAAFTPVGIAPYTICYVHFPTFLAHLEYARPSRLWFWRLYYSPVMGYWIGKVRSLDLLLCNSYFTQNAVKERWNRDAMVIYPPVDIAPFAKATIPFKERKNKVVAVGRLVPSKRFGTLAEMARELKGIRVTVIGKLQDMAYYRQLLSVRPENMTFKINATFNEMVHELSTAKVYIHPMIGEHFGISIVEAMAAGCVPIVHDSGGAREIVTNNVGFRWRTVDEAVDQVNAVLENQALGQKLSKGAMERARLFEAKYFEDKIKLLFKAQASS